MHENWSEVKCGSQVSGRFSHLATGLSARMPAACATHSGWTRAGVGLGWKFLFQPLPDKALAVFECFVQVISGPEDSTSLPRPGWILLQQNIPLQNNKRRSINYSLFYKLVEYPIYLTLISWYWTTNWESLKSLTYELFLIFSDNSWFFASKTEKCLLAKVLWSKKSSFVWYDP